MRKHQIIKIVSYVQDYNLVVDEKQLIGKLTRIVGPTTSGKYWWALNPLVPKEHLLLHPSEFEVMDSPAAEMLKCKRISM